MIKLTSGGTIIVAMTAILAGGSVEGCSRDTERSPSVETASSSTNVQPADSALAKTDTSSRIAPESTPEPETVIHRPRTKPRRANVTAPVKPAPPPSDTSAAPANAPASDTANQETRPDESQGQYLKYDASTNTVTFDLIGGPSGFAFNGHTSGGATLTLPPKANVVMPFVNKDGTPHSAEVISGEGPLPNAGGDPAIPRAYTNQLLQGLAQEASDVMRFTVPESGTYRIFCGVPGHGLSGMWIWMRVDPSAKAPSFGPTKT